MSVQGTTPHGVRGERETAAWVRQMFSDIAPRYDLLNHLLSFNIDRYWRARTVKRVSPVLSRPSARAIDLCCGTGDMTLALAERADKRVFGSDFCHPMLLGANRKANQRRASVEFFESDATELPLADKSMDVLTVAFGFRNLANYEKGLHELLRILRPGGIAAILEFTRTANPMIAPLYNFYFRNILPQLGGAISGSKDAYKYLPESVAKFPTAGELAVKMREAGFSTVNYELMTFGTVALHIGTLT